MMRTLTRLTLATALGLFVSIGLVGVAHAGESEPTEETEEHSEFTEEEAEEITHEAELLAESNGATEFDLHCIEIHLEGGTADDCQEAPNQLLPELNEIIWGGIAFAIIFFFISAKGFPAIKKSMNDRTETIRGDLAEAENAKVDAQGVLTDYKAQLADAKSESGRIIEEARQQADQVRRDQEAKLQADLGEMRSKAAADIEASKEQVMGDLQGDVAALAIGAAEVVVEKNLDQATQVQLIENYINQVNQRS